MRERLLWASCGLLRPPSDHYPGAQVGPEAGRDEEEGFLDVGGGHHPRQGEDDHGGQGGLLGLPLTTCPGPEGVAHV